MLPQDGLALRLKRLCMMICYQCTLVMVLGSSVGLQQVGAIVYMRQLGASCLPMINGTVLVGSSGVVLG